MTETDMEGFNKMRQELGGEMFGKALRAYIDAACEPGDVFVEIEINGNAGTVKARKINVDAGRQESLVRELCEMVENDPHRDEIELQSAFLGPTTKDRTRAIGAELGSSQRVCGIVR